MEASTCTLLSCNVAWHGQANQSPAEQSGFASGNQSSVTDFTDVATAVSHALAALAAAKAPAVPAAPALQVNLLLECHALLMQHDCLIAASRLSEGSTCVNAQSVVHRANQAFLDCYIG